MDRGQGGLGSFSQHRGKVMMELAVAPPPRVAAGVRLQNPLVVTFSATSKPGGDDDHQSGQVIALPDLSGIWVFLSLSTAGMEEIVPTRQEDLFHGNRADSIHQLYRKQNGDRPTIAYAVFPGLIVSQPGNYRVKINLIDMDAAFRGDPAKDAGKVLQCLYSPVFEVVQASEHSGCESKLAETIGRLRSIGVNC